MKRRNVYHILFWGYCVVMAFLLFGRMRYNTSAGYWVTLSQHMNLIPLHTVRLFVNVLVKDFGQEMRREAVINLFGNVAMFLPLGFFPQLLWKPFNRLWKTLLWGAGIIVAVELIQLFGLVGNCDIDDLLLNVVGIALGYGIGWLLIRRKQTENNP